jgi:hypothetical protein
MAHDNLDVLIRPGIGKKMGRNFFQDLRVISTRTTKLTTGLKKYAEYYGDGREEWPASPYYTARVKEHIGKMEGRHECDLSEFFLPEDIPLENPFTPGQNHSTPTLDDPRVSR